MTKSVGSTLKDLSGNPMTNIPIEIELVLGQSWSVASDVGLANLYRTATDTNGSWSATLQENDSLTPVGTAYRVVERFPAQFGGSRVYLIQVLTTLSGGLNQAADLIIPELSPVGSINNFLTKAYADATFATLGTSGSAGPPGPVGPAGGTSVPMSYPTEVALLADSPSNGVIAYATDTGRFWARTSNTWRYLTGGTNVTIQSATLSGGPTVGTTPLAILGLFPVAPVPFARIGIYQASILKTVTIGTDTFELSVSDGSQTRAAQNVGPGTGLFQQQTPLMIAPIAANAAPLIQVFLTRIAGTGTATVSALGSNYCRIDALYKRVE